MRILDAWIAAFPRAGATRFDRVNEIVSWASLPNIVRSEIRALEDELEPDLYLTWHKRVAECLSKSVMGLDSSMTSVLNPIGEDALALIKICDDKLSRSRFADPPMDHDVVATLEKDAQTLAQEVVASPIEVSLKEYILYHLSLAEQAIHDYRVQGPGAFKRAAESSVGAAVLAKEKFEQARNSEFGARFVLIIGAILYLSDCKEAAKSLVDDGETVLALIEGATRESVTKSQPSSAEHIAGSEPGPSQ